MDESWLTENLPVLGEPVPIELANTHYRDGDDVIEFLASTTMAATWFATSPTASLLRTQAWTVRGLQDLISIRDTIDDLVRARIARQHAPRAIVEHLNGVASLLTSRVELQWDAPGVVRAVQHHRAADKIEVALGRIATDTIALLAGPDAALLRVCANDNCQMLFLKRHHRRRWCHESCGHRHRQAVYYRSHKRASSPT